MAGLKVAVVLLLCLWAVSARRHAHEHHRRHVHKHRHTTGVLLATDFVGIEQWDGSKWIDVTVTVTVAADGDATFTISDDKNAIDFSDVTDAEPVDPLPVLDPNCRTIFITPKDSAKRIIFRAKCVNGEMADKSQDAIGSLMLSLRDRSAAQLEMMTVTDARQALQNDKTDGTVKTLAKFSSIIVSPRPDSDGGVAGYQLLFRAKLGQVTMDKVAALKKELLALKPVVDAGLTDQQVKVELVSDVTEFGMSFDQLKQQLNMHGLAQVPKGVYGEKGGSALVGGVTTAPKGFPKGFGTLGGFFTHRGLDGNFRLFAVSNHHVWPSDTGVTMCQPSEEVYKEANPDCDKTPEGCCRRLGGKTAGEYNKAGNPLAVVDGNVDAAITEVDLRTKPHVACAIKELGPVGGVSYLANILDQARKNPFAYTIDEMDLQVLGKKVIKYGSRTHWTKGKIHASYDEAFGFDFVIRALHLPQFSDESKSQSDARSPASEPDWFAEEVEKPVKEALTDAYPALTAGSDLLNQVFDELSTQGLIRAFSSAGDSGSFILDDDLKVMGLLKGGQWVVETDDTFGSVTVKGEKYFSVGIHTIGYTITHVLERLNAQVKNQGLNLEVCADKPTVACWLDAPTNTCFPEALCSYHLDIMSADNPCKPININP